MPVPRLRAALGGLASCQPTDGVYGPERLRPLSANESPHRPLPGITTAMAAALDINRYPDPECAKLTRELARRIGVGQDQVRLAGLRAGYLVGAADVVAQLRKACLAYAVSNVAQDAALAALGLEEDLPRLVSVTVAERAGVRGILLARGWDVPDLQANEGVRVSIGTAEDNDAFLAAARQWRDRAA